MADSYHQGSVQLQSRFDTERLANRIAERLVKDRIGDEERAFIQGMDFFFLATADGAGRPTCSYKGGEPGFVRVVDDGTLAFPSYDGNGMFLSLGNVLVNPHVGLLFISFDTPQRLRVEGEASVHEEDPLLAAWPEAQLVVRVRVRAAYPNCARYIPRMRVEERSPFVPRAGCTTPVPSWKRSEWARDVLPAGDARKEEGGGGGDPGAGGGGAHR